MSPPDPQAESKEAQESSGFSGGRNINASHFLSIDPHSASRNLVEVTTPKALATVNFKAAIVYYHCHNQEVNQKLQQGNPTSQKKPTKRAKSHISKAPKVTPDW